MFIERFKKMFSKEEGNSKKKMENITVFIIILIVTIVAINYIWNGDKEKKTKELTPKVGENNDIVQVTSEVSEDETEKKLANILSNIQGVGKVKVLITYSETSTYVPIYNEDSKVTNTTETDSSGGSRTISEENNQKEVVYKEDGSGKKEPITKNIISPKVEGAIITAEGAGSAEVKANIIQAMEAATGLATHKIQVFKMGV